MFAIAPLNFRLLVRKDDIRISVFEFLDPENIEIAVGIMFLFYLEAEICLGCLHPPPRSRRTSLFHGMKVKQNRKSILN